MTHICVCKLTNIGSDNGLSPGRRQAIIWTNAGILSIWPLATNFIEISIEIHSFWLKKMHLKMSFAKTVAILSRPQSVEYHRYSCLCIFLQSNAACNKLTHWDKMASFLQTTFWIYSLICKLLNFLNKISLKYFSHGVSNNKPALV